MNKSKLRSYYRNVRNNISKREDAQKIITKNFLEHELYLKAESVFLYFSYLDEVSTRAIAMHVLNSGKKLAYPVCADKDGNMRFYFVKSHDELKKGMYSIMEPDISICKMALPNSNTLTVVPALCFDRNGYRLGYGRGYYDRFLSEYEGKSIGLAFEECVCDFLPVNDYDKKVDSLITDKRIYNFSLTKEE